MQITDVVWWFYSALLLLAGVFLVAFILTVRNQGE